MKSTTLLLGSMLGAILLSLTGCAMDTGGDEVDPPSSEDTGAAHQAMISAGQCQALSDGCAGGEDQINTDSSGHVSIVRRNQCRNWYTSCKDSLGTAGPCAALEADCYASGDAGICTILQQTCTGT